MRVQTNYTLHLNEKEAKALKRLLGSMTDPEFAKAGISGERREIMREIWENLPSDDGE